MAAANLATRWLKIWPELAPPADVRPVVASAMQLGWRSTLEVDWRLDVMLGSLGGDGQTSFIVPAVTVRPLLRLPLDVARVRIAYLEWRERVVQSQRPAKEAGRAPVPPVRDLLLRPPTGPRRTCDALCQSPLYWFNRRDLVNQALRAAKVPEPTAAWDEVAAHLVDYPHVVATLPHEQRLWEPGLAPDPSRKRPKPSRFDSVDRISTPSDGERRRYTAPHLAGELFRALPDGRSRSTPASDEAARLSGPLKAVWAVRAAMDLGHEAPCCDEVAEVRAWVASMDEDGEAAMAEAAGRLVKYCDNREQQAMRGRVNEGVHLPRLIGPYICPDLSVAPRPATRELLEASPWMDELIVGWLRSASFLRMTTIISGGDRDTLRCRSSDGTLAAFLGERSLPFQRVCIRFPVGDPRQGQAIALGPSRHSGDAVEVDATGFGDPEEVVMRWFGTTDVPIIGIQTTE